MKKMEKILKSLVKDGIFLSATYAFNPKIAPRSIRLPHSMVHEDLFQF